MENLYQILGLPDFASTEEVKKSFKRLALLYHPDRNPNSLTAEETFKVINKAYQILSDPETKHRYDLLLLYVYGKATQAETDETPAHRDPRYRRRNPYRRPYQAAPVVEKDSLSNTQATLISVGAILYIFLFVNSIYNFIGQNFYSRATEAYQKQQYEDAIKYLNGAIGYDPSLANAYFLRAQIYAENFSLPKDALEDYSKGIETTSIFKSEYFLWRGRTNGKLQNKNEAHQDFQTALFLSSDDMQLASQVAKGYSLDLNAYKDAIDIYNSLLSKNKPNYDLYRERGITYALAGEYQDAIADFKAGFRQHQNSDKALHELLSFCETELKKPDFTAALLEAIIAENKEDVEKTQKLRVQKAIILYQSKSYSATLSELNTLIAQQSKGEVDSLYAWRAKTLLEMGESAKACEDWAKARFLGYKAKHPTLDFFCEESLKDLVVSQNEPENLPENRKN
ncbi:DnaJ domain-containing protein [Hugenholtzia roseola]|uniref:DnaJ domain-containing protein n=1 Tax=Hugenholtzia roseola TaxID=1002 RepID=UPI0004090E86|nr:DnaJ domain-containing protein [Hugenholtzia roseola]